MWRMLLGGGTAVQVRFEVLEEDGTVGVVRWEAEYRFGAGGRLVRNRVYSVFELREGLIYRQRDSFVFWRWAAQALGWKGLLLGWLPLVRNKVRATAAARLARAMQA